jgi:hypothetical protein
MASNTAANANQPGLRVLSWGQDARTEISFGASRYSDTRPRSSMKIRPAMCNQPWPFAVGLAASIARRSRRADVAASPEPDDRRSEGAVIPSADRRAGRLICFG